MYHWSGQRGWNFSNAYEHAMVKQYEERKSDFVKYKKQCIEDGKNGELTDDFVTNVRLKMLKTTDYGLICCCPTPRIGVFLKSKTTKPSLHHFYSFLSKMYEQAESQLKCWNNQYEQFGCHLCLFVSGQKQSAKVTEQIYHGFHQNGELRCVQIVGYLQMEETQYFRWLPDTLKSFWLTEFEKFDHFVKT
ncbi:unnamed protein product [Didymodactylos carnosus]|uniref:Uncharacterized protein n=1 Tax=Didymodactylos carnosus TaxID=1234261 RepID=A0A8S2J970_9BILA|nr:unnamed protein product [Didymodactylos carnosus]CAF3797826.1 unnamed protein product [Didymodactylos carnosus]